MTREQQIEAAANFNPGDIVMITASMDVLDRFTNEPTGETREKMRGVVMKKTSASPATYVLVRDLDSEAGEVMGFFEPWQVALIQAVPAF